MIARYQPNPIFQIVRFGDEFRQEAIYVGRHPRSKKILAEGAVPTSPYETDETLLARIKSDYECRNSISQW